MLRSFAKLKQLLKSRELFGMAHGGNFSGIYRKVQLKPLKWDGECEEERPVEALMILKYGGVLTHAGKVALSRVKSRSGLKILITGKEGKPKTKTLNVVYKQIFQNIP
ncbi:hypothetical protein IGI04_007161 [Brassica rapa subsp. trilocularis]|uniref:Uncharacterized protein n=1 Tax=Brassica rapa subsp. trilocularis TaxID=1813537 RepID=A0ABQ7NIY1_BRACM|nr:hypothetical protein IGI04_007161 [Brassica rapa subsp. trilocularis]